MTSRDKFEAWINADSARESRVIRIVRDRDWYAGRDKHFLNTSWSAWQASSDLMQENYEAARDRKNSITLLQMQRDRLLEALQEMEMGSGTSPGANKKYQKAREAIAFVTGKEKP